MTGGEQAARERSARADALRGILLMLCSMSAIAVLDAIAKLLSHRLPGVQVTWGYFTCILLALTVYAALRGRSIFGLLRSRRPVLQILRAAALVGSLSLLFTGLAYLPLAEATTISFTSPLFVVALSGPLLGERVGLHRWGAVIVGLLGAVIVMRPGSEMFQPAALFPLFGAVFFAFFQIVTRRLGNADDPITTIAWTAGGGALILTPVMPFVWMTPVAPELAIFVGMGALGLVAHLCLVGAFALGDASMLAPFNYVRILWAIALGVVLFGDWPDVGTLVGGAVIVASGLYVLVRESRAGHPPPQHRP